MVQTATMTPKRHSEKPGIAVRRLDLTRFRNYPSTRLEISAPGENCIVLVGENGAGKTNLLEALSYLGPGRGLRGARLDDITTNGDTGAWAVSAVFAGQGEQRRIGCAIEYANKSEGVQGRARRVIVMDETPLSGAAALAPYISIIWLTPRMDRLFQEGASERRRFFDQIVVGLFPDHARQLYAYEKTTRERLKVLTGHGNQRDETWISALERRMAEHAIAIAAARLEGLELLKTHLSFASESRFPIPVLALKGEVEDLLKVHPALAAEEQLAGLLAGERTRDGERGQTGRGAHKTDLQAWHPEKDIPASQCSTGEQKAMLTGIVLAAARLQMTVRGRSPILLLDEVAAHLDQERRTSLFEEVATLGVQTWLTGTDAAIFSPLKGKALFLRVTDGVIENINQLD